MNECAWIRIDASGDDNDAAAASIDWLVEMYMCLGVDEGSVELTIDQALLDLIVIIFVCITATATATISIEFFLC